MDPSQERLRGHTGSNPQVIVPFPVPSSDAGLVAALRANHHDARRVLCERYSGELLTVATRLLGPDRCAGPIVIDTLRWTLTHIDSLAEPRTLRVWMLSRLVTLVRRRLRAQRVWRWLGGVRADNWFAGARCSEQLVATYCVLERLSVEQRLAFCLIVIHSMGLAEVGAVLGVSTLDVRSTAASAHALFDRLAQLKYRGLTMQYSSHAALGREIAKEQERMLGESRIYEFDLTHRSGPMRWSLQLRGRQLAWALALAPLLLVPATAAAALVAYFQGVEFRVQGEETTSSDTQPLGLWVVASSQQAKIVFFSDGSNMKLVPGTSVRMMGTNHRGGTSTLESGSVTLSVADGSRTEYLVAAGPFVVALTKGQAEITWDSADEVLELTVHQGYAAISGCQFGEGNSVTAGKSLQARCFPK